VLVLVVVPVLVLGGRSRTRCALVHPVLFGVAPLLFQPQLRRRPDLHDDLTVFDADELEAR